MAQKAPAPSPDSPPPDRLDTQEFARNMLTVGMKSQQLLLDFAGRMASRENAGPIDPLNISGAMMALAKAMSGDREAVIEAQTQWWNNFMTLWESTARRMLGGEAPAVVEPAPGDRRFRSEEWRENEIFDFIKQSYLLTANAMQEMVGKLNGLDARERSRVAFYTRQFADAMAPTNFPMTNPDVLKATIASNGENLVKGLDNLLADVERGQGELSIRQSADGFTIGENVATAPGKVVFRNEIMELLQYSPSTDEVHERPLLIFPPWINKYYIIDLRPENSFVRWLVGRGYTVFLVSWVNPDADMAGKGFEDYMKGGIFAALDAVEKATGVRDPNCVGYCIGGTLLAATLAYMASKGDDRVHSATFWAAQTDFSEAGELSVFVDEAQLEALKAKMDSEGGVLPGSKMAGAFNMLRANDLIWSFVINNYLLGKQPMPFDLLYWNSDTTRMPEKLHLSYLRNCYKENALALGEMKMAGVKLDLTKVKVPVYLQSAREDHIAPANSVFKSVNLFSGPVRFIIAGSGHIAGVINPPASKKYQYWTNDGFAEQKGAKTIEAWKKGSTEHPGSWWPDWDQWLSKLSGAKIPARQPGDGGLKVLGDAPDLCEGEGAITRADTMNAIINVLIEHSAEFAILDPLLKGAARGGIALAKDWVGPERLDAIKDIFERAAEKLKRKNVTPEPPPLSILLPLLEAAQDEGRAELRDIWASLLAAASDPARLGIFRRDFIDIAKQLEPVDAICLKIIQGMSGSYQPDRVVFVANRLQLSTDQVSIAFNKLHDLKLVTSVQQNGHHPALDALGRLFMQVVSD